MKKKEMNYRTCLSGIDGITAGQALPVRGFTLAEVLITLTIIGVITAITVPVIMQNMQKQEFVTALKKAHSTLSQAANQIIAEEGSPKCNDGGWACSPDTIYEMFKKYLNNARECGTAEGCFEHTYRNLDGGGGTNRFTNTTYYRRLALADGMQIVFDTAVKDCANDMCTWIRIDLNGEKKPNILGRDVFQFILGENSLYPRGCNGETECPNGTGIDCACKVLREGAMNY